jgi:alpha-tubulin suppressor-like RCC1 family protein
VRVIDSRTFNLSGPVDHFLADADGLAAGERHSCSLQVDERIRCWGANNLGQLGTGNTNPQTLFAPTVSGSGGTIGARSVAVGFDQTCASRADGTVACWGSDLIPAAVTGFTQTLAVATGTSHKCALRSDGLVRCVGSNSRGQIGNGAGGATAPDVTDPAQGVVQNLTDIAAIAAGGNFTCALRVTGTVRCWGANDFGQLGNDAGGFQAGRFEPAPVLVQGLSAAIGLAAGREHACAVRVGGTVHCWGFNVFGQVGDSAANTVVDTPFEVKTITTGAGGFQKFVALSRAVAIAAGPDHSCALLVNGKSRCWGKNDVGQLGNGNGDFDSFFGAGPNPIAFDVASLSDAVALAAGGSSGPPVALPTLSSDFTCARRAGGTVSCWGANGSGQLGDDSSVFRLQPLTSVVNHVRSELLGKTFTLSVQLGGVSGITAGNLFGCALLASGQPFCWGSGNSFARPVSSSP